MGSKMDGGVSGKYSGYTLLTSEELAGLPDLVWLVDGILPKPCLGVLYGEPGCGKTFVALSIGLAVASGTDWLGRAINSENVLYIAAEGALGMKNRVAAHQKHCGQAKFDVRFLPDAPNLLEEQDMKRLIYSLNEASFRPGLIIIDTLARVTTGADENNARDMGRAVAALDALKTAFEASVLVLHHTTKNGASERGSSALRGAADVMVQCSKLEAVEGTAVSLECKKMKDDEPFKDIMASMVRVDLGGARSSLVVSHEIENIGISNAIGSQQIQGLLEGKFAVDGATNKELFVAFEASGFGSKSSFDRGLRAAKKAGLLRIDGNGRGMRYFPIGVSVNSVSS